MLYGDSEKDNGSYYGILGLLIGIMEKSMETTIVVLRLRDIDGRLQANDTTAPAACAGAAYGSSTGCLALSHGHAREVSTIRGPL